MLATICELVSSVALLHLKISLRLQLATHTADPTPRLHGPERTVLGNEDRLRIILASYTVGDFTDGLSSAHVLTIPES
jgi:hypothetical protein